MTGRDLFGCVGLLAMAFYVITQPGCAPDAARKVTHTIDKVEAVVQNARDAGGQSCDRAVPACSTYYGAVRAGWLRDDDRAEVACAGVVGVCELVGAAGAQ